MKKCNKYLRHERRYYLPSIVFLTLTLLSFTLLSSSSISADDSIVDNINITVPASCSLFGTGQNSHNATIVNGTYEEDIGTTTLKAFCNDAEGFAIYAAGYTGDEIGGTNSNKLVGTSASGNATIVTGLATSAGNPDVSNWAMKLATPSSPTPTYPITIDSDTNGSFSNYHIVPNEYVKVAHRDSATDVGTNAEGSTLTTTYRAYISKTQAADTYSGKVIYTLVHPSSHIAPVPVSKNLYYAITGEENNYTLTISDSDITSGAVAGGPVAIDGYEPYSAIPWSSRMTSIKSVVVDGNVAPTSIRHWFESLLYCNSWDLTGLKTDNVTDMSYAFSSAGDTDFVLDLSSWNTTNVTNMSHMFEGSGSPRTTTWTVGDLSSWDTANVTNMSDMFSGAGRYATTWSVGNLSSWDTANVTDMNDMFYSAGYGTTTWTVGDLSSWDTSNVTNMSGMFNSAGYNSTTWSVGDLSSWDTANVTDMSSIFRNAGRKESTTWSVGDISSWDTANTTSMSYMFYGAGYNAATFILDLSDWNTANVTNMGSMFTDAGRNATTWSVTIPQTNGASSSPISNTTSRFYGKTSSTSAAPPLNRSFTLAQP